MRQLSTQDADFDSQLTELLAFETVNDADLLKTVDDIIAQVRHDGDRVVLALTQQFDQHPATTMQELELSKDNKYSRHLYTARSCTQVLEES